MMRHERREGEYGGDETEREAGAELGREAPTRERLAILHPEALICSGLRALYKFG